MTISLTWAAIGIIIAISGNIFFTVWSAAIFKATISIKIDNLALSLQRIDKDIEKRDLQIAASWKKIDGISDRIIRMESKVL